MEVKAHYRNARMSPRKLRVYRPVVIGVPAVQAEAQLKFMPGEAPAILLKTLRSAMANAQNNFDIIPGNLTVTDVVVNAGFTLKRFRPVSKGMAHPILKRTSHVTVVVEDKVNSGKTTKKKAHKTKIKDITSEEFVTEVAKHSHDHEESEVEQKGNVQEPVDNTAHQSKQEAASNKVKMMQGGGDAKKTHRRKSLGGGN